MKIIDYLIFILTVAVVLVFSLWGGYVWGQSRYDEPAKVIYRTTEVEGECPDTKVIHKVCPETNSELQEKLQLYEEAERLEREVERKQQELMYKKY